MSKTPSRCTSYSRLFSIVDYFSTRPRMPTQADRSSIDSIGSLLVWMLNHLINMILMHPGGGEQLRSNSNRLYITSRPHRDRNAGVILAVGNTKGGVGKTTIAVNLAILRVAAGQDVLLVDGDEQGSASLFSQLRADLVGACGYTAVGLHGAALRTQVRQLATKYSDIVIDVGGRDTGSLRAALTVADVVL